MPVICAFKGCNASRLRNPELKFTHFVQPRTDLERAKRWINLIGRDDFSVRNITYKTILCEKHFEPGSDLNWKLNKRLEPKPFDVSSAVTDYDYVPVVKRPINPKSYESKTVFTDYDYPSTAQRPMNPRSYGSKNPSKISVVQGSSGRRFDGKFQYVIETLCGRICIEKARPMSFEFPSSPPSRFCLRG